MGTYIAKFAMREARPRSERLRKLGAGAVVTSQAPVSPVSSEGVSSVGLQFEQAMGFLVSGSPVTKDGTISVGLEAGREIPESNRILHNDGGVLSIQNIAVCVNDYPDTEVPHTMYVLVEELLEEE